MMTLKTWTSDNKYSAISVKTPSFVIDTEKFAEMVQYVHNDSVERKLNSAINKAEETYDNAILADDIEQAEKQIAKAKKALETFVNARMETEETEPDKIATIFGLSLGFASGKVGVSGFDNLYQKSKAYGLKYIGSEDWKDTRKAEFSGIKAGCNTLLSEKFDTSNKSVYKGFELSLRSVDVEMFINSVFGTYSTASEGKKDSKIYGVGRKATNKEKAFVLLCKAVFFRYGVDIDTNKARKLNDYEL